MGHADADVADGADGAAFTMGPAWGYMETTHAVVLCTSVNKKAASSLPLSGSRIQVQQPEGRSSQQLHAMASMSTVAPCRVHAEIMRGLRQRKVKWASCVTVNGVAACKAACRIHGL